MIYTAQENVAYDVKLKYEDGTEFDHKFVTEINTDLATIEKYKVDSEGKILVANDEFVTETISFSKIVADSKTLATEFVFTK